MRVWTWASLLATALAAALPAAAEPGPDRASPAKVKTFQVLGALDSGQPRRFKRVLSAVPEALRHRTIAFETLLAPGSILVRTAERRLYFILPGGEAIQYRVGVGRDGFTWSGTNRVSRKAEWPDWRPPPEMIRREAKRGRRLPDFLAGGPGNPLGARAIYIGDTEFRIHGTSEPWSIGRAVSSGCIRLMDEEVIDLYERVAIGATVVVEN
jgi:lipoprotein-anchoring transpeptidase ErfK/SrfK